MNYHQRLVAELEGIAMSGTVPRLLMHMCCAPCACAVFEPLSRLFELSFYFYNPNLYPEEEYRLRLKTAEKLIYSLTDGCCQLIEGKYEPMVFNDAVLGLEDAPEGGSRCMKCIRLRLEDTARYAREGGFEYFCTTLTTGPAKDAELINRIGTELSEKYGVKFLYSDFKKRNGYARSVEKSAELGLYRQNYCGCRFSLQ